MVGGFEFSNVIIFLASFGMILSLIYSLFLYNRIFFGSLQESFIRYYCDCSRLEFIVLITFVVLVLIGGVYPQIIFMFCTNTLISSHVIVLTLPLICYIKN